MKVNKSSMTRDSIYFVTLTIISLTLLNIPQLHDNSLMIMPGIIIFLLMPSYAITLLLYPSKELSNFPRILLSLTIGIILAILWVILSGYASLDSNLSYTLLSILIIIFVLIAHLSRKIKVKRQNKISNLLENPDETKYDSNLRQTAKIAAIETKKSMDNQTGHSNRNKNHNRKELEILRPKKAAYDLFIIMAISLVSLIIIFLPDLNQNPAKIGLLLILVFFLQGYSILDVLIPNFIDKNILNRIFLSIIVSVLILVILGIISAFIPFDTYSLFILIIAIITLCMSIMAYVKRVKIIKSKVPIKESLKTNVVKKATHEDIKIYTPADARKGNLNSEPAWVKISRKKQEAKTEIPKKHLEKSSKEKIISKGPRVSEYQGMPEIPIIKESDYVKKINKQNAIKLLLIILFSALGLIFVLVPGLNDGIWRLIFTIPLVFFIPGYAIKELVFPNRFKGIIQTGLISVVFSILVLSILGLILPLISNSLPSSTYIIILIFISIICILLAIIRSQKHAESVHEVLERIEIDRIIKSVQTMDNEIIADQLINKKLDNILGNKILEDDLKLSFLTDDYFQVTPMKDKNEIEEVPGNENPTPNSDNAPNPDGDNDNGKTIISKLSFLGNDMFLIFLITLITLIGVIKPSFIDTRLITTFGLLFVLFIPGYMLLNVLFPRKDDLNPLVRLALSFGLSITIASLMGFALDYTPFSIKESGLALILFTIILGILTLIRHRSIKKEKRFQANIFQIFGIIKNYFPTESRLNKILSILLVISLVIAISTAAYMILVPQEGEKFTEFYILGANGQASDYPTNLTLGETGTVKIGVVNHESSKVNYKLVIILNGTTIEEQEITLLNNQTWQQDFNFTPTMTGNNKKLEFLLYKLPDQTNVYRSLHIWVSVI